MLDILGYFSISAIARAIEQAEFTRRYILSRLIRISVSIFFPI